MQPHNTPALKYDPLKTKNLYKHKKESSHTKDYEGIESLKKRYGNSFTILQPNNRSTDFVIHPQASFVRGCPFLCSYCYVTRNNMSYNENKIPVPSNPINWATDVDEILLAIKQEAKNLPAHKIPNQCHPVFYTIDIGEYSDMLSPQLTHLTNKIITQLVTQDSNLATSFASKVSTKHNVNLLIDCPVPYKARIRASVAPQWVINQTELGTAKLVDRLEGLNQAYNKGYEVHLNFSPMVITPTFEQDYSDLLQLIRRTLSPQVLSQIKYEGIFLTHNQQLHKKNEIFFPTNSEDLLWSPDNQISSLNQRGNPKIEYIYPIRRNYINKFRNLISTYLPECLERYLF